MGPNHPGGVLSEKKKRAPARKHPVVVRMFFYKKTLISRFWMKKTTRPQRWNDQKWCQTLYLPIGMPQTCYYIKKYENQPNGKNSAPDDLIWWTLGQSSYCIQLRFQNKLFLWHVMRILPFNSCLDLQLHCVEAPAPWGSRGWSGAQIPRELACE